MIMNMTAQSESLTAASISWPKVLRIHMCMKKQCFYTPATFNNLLVSSDQHPPPHPMSFNPSVFFRRTSTQGLINASSSSSHMQMHPTPEHDSLLISFREPRRIKNIQDAVPFAKKKKKKSLPASEWIKYGRFPLLIHTGARTQRNKPLHPTHQPLVPI